MSYCVPGTILSLLTYVSPLNPLVTYEMEIIHIAIL